MPFNMLREATGSDTMQYQVWRRLTIQNQLPSTQRFPSYLQIGSSLVWDLDAWLHAHGTSTEQMHAKENPIISNDKRLEYEAPSANNGELMKIIWSN